MRHAPVDFSVDPVSKEESFSSLLDRLKDLEEKVDSLQAKPLTMPLDKEELLNAAVRRVDALEAELISTKQVRERYI